MEYALEATVDVCFRIGHFRNLTDHYLRSIFLHISTSAGTIQASPYLIISNNPNPSSITLFQYVSPLYSFSPYAKAELSELAVFRLHIPIQQIETSTLRCTFTLFQQQFGGIQRVLDEITINHTTLLWVNSYCPVFFMNNGCGVDLTVETQMLKYRVKQIDQAPNFCLNKAVQTLLISYNKLKNRVSPNSAIQCEDFGEELTIQLAQAMKQSRRKIFQSQIKSEKGKLIEVAQKYIPEIGDLVMQTWSNYLKELKSKSIEEERKNYLNSLCLMVKENVYHQGHVIALNPEKNELHLQTIKLKTIPITITQLERHDIEVSISQKNHFVFLVHGYGATTSATRQLELTLRYLYPHLIIVNSIVNQDKTEDSLQNMGKRLASEVQTAIKSHLAQNDFSISFIAHSLGGLIVRSALTLLEALRYSMKNYISLGTPHLGHLFHNSSLNRLGMWTLAKLKKSQVMAALLLQTEEGNYRKSHLYELSLRSGLNWFEQVCLYGCSGDKFVSLQSALCMSSSETQAGQRQGNQQACVWQQMKKNLTVLLREVGVTKYQVDFTKQNSMSESSLTDDLLGRRDHMNLLCSQTFIECFLANSKNMFL